MNQEVQKYIGLLSLLLLHAYIMSAIPLFTTSQGNGAHLQTDGKIVVSGTGEAEGTRKFLLARYEINGSLDATFGSEGVIATTIGDEAFAESLCIQSDGKIIVVGGAIIDAVNHFAIARYLPTGSLDTSFSGSGIATTLVGEGGRITSCFLQEDGKLVVAGVAILKGQPNIVVARYRGDGTLDTTFGTLGIVTTAIGTVALSHSVALQPDGKIVVGGFAVISGVSQIVITRYFPNGLLDTTFGNEGVVTALFGSSATDSELKLQPDGKIVTAVTVNKKFGVARFEADGELDVTFATNGVQLSELGSFSAAYGLCLQPDGKILAAGFADEDLVVARYQSDGSVDTTFGDNGIVETRESIDNVAHAVITQTDGKIVAVGFSSEAVLVVRYNADGSKDTTFGASGVVTMPGGELSEITKVTHLYDSKPIGSNGGTFAAGAWQTRMLNKLTGDISSVVLSNNQFILQSGIYEVSVQAPAYRVNSHQIRLRNITDSLTEKLGTSARASDVITSSVTYSVLEQTVVIAKPTIFEIQHRAETTHADDGFGVATGFDDDEVYTTVSITRRSVN